MFLGEISSLLLIIDGLISYQAWADEKIRLVLKMLTLDKKKSATSSQQKT